LEQPKEPKNKKNQTFLELISLMKHHNETHRKGEQRLGPLYPIALILERMFSTDAINEVQALINQHTYYVPRIQGKLLETVATLFLDEQSDIRKSVRQFLVFSFSLIPSVIFISETITNY
jgi:hypothetical protein